MTTCERCKGATIERDRLAHLLRRYDRCRCGWLRHHHDDGRPIACAGFELVEPADPLETIIDGEGDCGAA